MADKFNVDDIVVFRANGGDVHEQSELECLDKVPLRIVELPDEPWLAPAYSYAWVLPADEDYEWPSSLDENYKREPLPEPGERYKIDIYLLNLAPTGAVWVPPVTMLCASCDGPLTEIDYLCESCR
jgi:hypothetical protein